MFNIKYPETYTQAFHAGAILAMVHNHLPLEKAPSFIEGAVHFSALRESLGENLWQRMKSRQMFRKRVAMYESLSYQPGTPRSLIGRGEDFALGYVRCYKESKKKHLLDKQRQSDITAFLER